MPEPWFYSLVRLIGVAIAVAAAAWGVLALFEASPRSVLTRPRRVGRRCPGRWRWLPVPWHLGCWYDLTGVPRGRDGRTTCPECGRTSRERSLRRRRVRGRVALLMLVPVQVIAYAVWCLPRVWREGWMGWVPTTGLVLLVDQMRDSYRPDGVPSNAGQIDGENLFYAMHRRGRAGEVAPWQWTLALDRCGPVTFHDPLSLTAPPLGRTPQQKIVDLAFETGNLTLERHRRVYWQSLHANLVVRERYPAGGRVVAWVELYYDDPMMRFSLVPDGFLRVDDGPLVTAILTPGRIGTSFEGSSAEMGALAVDLGAVEEVAARGAFDVGFLAPVRSGPRAGVLQVLQTWEVPVTVIAVGALADAIELVESPESFSAAQSTPPAVLVRDTLGEQSGPRASLRVRIETLLALVRGHGSITAGLRFEVIRDGEVVGREARWVRVAIGASERALYPIANGRILPTSERLFAAGEADWQLRVTADPAIALRDNMSERALVGQVTLPLLVRDELDAGILSP